MEKSKINTDGCVMLACEMLEPELKKVMSEKNAEYPVVWIERALHEWPDKLRDALQKEIDNHPEAEYLLLAFGLCGNAVAGLKSNGQILVIPKFDDCIRMFTTLEKGRPSDVSTGCMYYTKGWIESECFLSKEVAGYYEKYGKKKAEIIINTLFKNYHGLRLIDTGAYNTEDYMDALKEAADRLNMDTGVCPGTVRVLEKLVTKQWDDEFCLIPAGGTVGCELFWNL